MKRFLVAFALAAYAAHGASAETLTASTGGRTNWDSVILEMGAAKGFFKQEGIDFELSPTDGGAATLQPAVAGRVDLALAVGFLSVISAYAKGAPIKVISAEATGAPELFWYTKPSSGIKGIKDAAGKTMAYSANGSTSNLMLLALLNQEKVAAKPIATGTTATTMTQVMTGQIDVGYSVAPFGLPDVEAGKIIILARSTDVVSMRNETIRVNVANAEALKTKRAAIEKFFRGYLHTLDWAYSDPHGFDALAEALAMPRELIIKAMPVYYPKAMFQLADIRGLASVMEEAVATKNIAAPLSKERIADFIDIVPKPRGK